MFCGFYKNIKSLGKKYFTKLNIYVLLTLDVEFRKNLISGKSSYTLKFSAPILNNPVDPNFMRPLRRSFVIFSVFLFSHFPFFSSVL